LRADVPQVDRRGLPRIPDARDRPRRLPSLSHDARAPAGRHRRAPGALRLEAAAVRVRDRPPADRRAARRSRRARGAGERRRSPRPRTLVAPGDRDVPKGVARRPSLPLRVAAMRAICLLPLLGVLGSVALARAGAQSDFYLHDGDRVVFYGDSITEQRLYPTFVETYV